MVCGSHPKTRAIYSTPPCPSLAASIAAYRRRSFSDSHPKNRCIFCSISAEYPSMPYSLIQNLLRGQDTTARAIREVILDHILTVASLYLGRVMGHRLGNEPPTFVIRSREAADEQGITQRGQIVLGHQRRIGHVDIGAWRHPMLGQEGRNVRQEAIVDGFIRGIAILWGAPEGDGTVNAE